ncbi:MAG: VPLPA-CTERM sorting domain-containing protein [Deferrisomatales bacterium]|nr:VPLPA-CTERM sorting domain-containing protein [Deferrisomatales bacterium]
MTPFKSLLYPIAVFLMAAAGPQFARAASLDGSGSTFQLFDIDPIVGVTLDVSDWDFGLGGSLYVYYGSSDTWVPVSAGGGSVPGFGHLEQADFGIDRDGDPGTFELLASRDAVLTYSALAGPALWQTLKVDFAEPGGRRLLVLSTTDAMAPVPIPSAGLLLISGLAGLAVVRRTRRNENEVG